MTCFACLPVTSKAGSPESRVCATCGGDVDPVKQAAPRRTDGEIRSDWEISRHAAQRWTERIGEFSADVVKSMLYCARPLSREQRKKIRAAWDKIGKRGHSRRLNVRNGCYLLIRDGIVFVARAPRTLITVYRL